MPRSKQRRLKKGKQVSRLSVMPSKLKLHKLDWLEWTTIGLSLWFLFYPYPYKILLGLLLFIPLLGLLLNGLHKPSIISLVEVSIDKDGELEYDVADFIDIAAWVILIRVLLDFEFESVYSLIIPGTISFAVIVGILFLTHRQLESSTKNKWWIYGSIIFSICMYSYAGIYAANCTYDYLPATVYNTEVLDKRISNSRRSTTYYIQIAPWGHHYDKEEISVRKAQYEEISVGEHIHVDLKKGLFGIPWYYIDND